MDNRIALAGRYAAKYNVDKALLCAIIEQESGWDPFAVRYEPKFYGRYVMPLGLESPTEAYSRAFSWGLMQLMGECAREDGFKGKFLSELLDPDVGVDWGTRHFSMQFQKAGLDVPRALLLWNGGGNLKYPSQVLARVKNYQ